MTHTLIFVTANTHKFAEATAILGDQVTLTQQSLDLQEIQAVQVSEVIQHKLPLAYEKVAQPLICEDTGLYIQQLNHFPGALIKHYLQRIGPEGICRLHGGSPAYAETVVGYHDGKQMHFFKGKIEGTIAQQTQGQAFGWSTAFIPHISGDTAKRTFAQIPQKEKITFSMRGKAFQQLSHHLRG